MPRGRRSRTKEDYEREIEEAATRIKKYPEHLRSARTSSIWNDFLIDIGVKPEIVKSKSGGDFWDKVRNRVEEKELGITYRQAAEHGADIETYERTSSKGKVFTQIAFRNMETGRFVSRKSLEN